MSSDKTDEGQAEETTAPPATAEEQEKIEGFLELLRQQNLNVTSIPLNQPDAGAASDASSNTGAGNGTGTGGTAANLIADNALETLNLGGNNDNNSGRKKHAFWDTQPMFLENPTTATSSNIHAPLIPNKPKSELRQDPYNMPKGFVWSDLDIKDETQLNQIYDLLTHNYVEDDDCMFRFDYSTDFLKWALSPPNYTTSFHLGVRSSKSNKLVAFISAIPATVRAYEEIFPSVEINFLCVHKKLRSKRLAPVLIKEITRRVNHTGVFQAVYTAGVVLPGPISSCRYHHRSLNPKKLVEIGFSRIPPRMTMARMIKLYRVFNEPKLISGNKLHKLEMKYVDSAHALLVEHLKQFELTVEFSREEFIHWFMPRDNVITTYVVCNDENDGDKVTDMISYYHLHSTIMGNPKHDHLYAAYSFYNVATTVPLANLMKDALSIAKNEGMDVFNALEQMKNAEFLSECKFGKGDGNLQYYLYNWCCPTMDPKNVGIVLL